MSISLSSWTMIAAQSTAFSTNGSQNRKKKGGSKKYYNDAEWRTLSSESQTNFINEHKEALDNNNSYKTAIFPNPPSQSNLPPRL
jgi:hypothetical protein